MFSYGIVLIFSLLFVNINSYIINNNNDDVVNNSVVGDEKVVNSFDGVYSECFMFLSYTCIQRKTLLYLNELNTLKEVSVFGDHLKFVKLNKTQLSDENELFRKVNKNTSSHDLSLMIDKAVDSFFDRHALRVSALGKDILVPRTVDEFVGRKRRKGGGGGGGGDGGHGDGGKKKMMMMVMMCMKMKLMMMIPAMMGMMGMMSFKGMMFSMMSFMISKMMLLMKILEKKNGGGGGAGGDGGGGWAAGGGGGGAWMPAGGQDYGGGGAGGGGGYDANGQWQSRSIPAQITKQEFQGEINPIAHTTKAQNRKHLATIKTISDELIKIKAGKAKSRRKRSIIDVLQNAYLYWTSKILGYNSNRPKNVPKYKIVNGIKYVYYPMKYMPKVKSPKLVQPDVVEATNEDPKAIITAQDFNKGEIVEGGFESRMQRKKFNKMKKTVDEALDDSPWQ